MRLYVGATFSYYMQKYIKFSVYDCTALLTKKNCSCILPTSATLVMSPSSSG